MSGDANTLLCEVEGDEAATAVGHALTDESIPYRAIGQPGLPTTFLVPARHVERARDLVDAYLLPHGEAPELDDDDPSPRGAAAPLPFPWATVQVVAATVLFHSGLVLWAGNPWPGGADLWPRWSVGHGLLAAEPWRLVTSLFLHADLPHVLWNGMAMLIFAVPVATWLSGGRAAAAYLVAGVAGGVAAAQVAEPGVIVLGSSGAVAGLFGAWLALAWRRGRATPMGWRPRVRSLGIALLVLPGLIGPVGSGRAAPLATQLAGAAAGLAVGATASLKQGTDTPSHDLGALGCE